MAKVSKARPWAVEIQPPGVGPDQWFLMNAYRDQDTAESEAALGRKRAPEAKIRVTGPPRRLSALWREDLA
jgi:hypothetical protein